MDADRFDMFLRTLTKARPRRSLASALASMLFAGGLSAGEIATTDAKKKKKKKKRKKNREKDDCNPGCSGGTLCCNGQCVSVLTDRGNCGECGRSCGVTEICRNAQCVPCEEPFALCAVAGEMQCVDVRNDRNNCGFCGNICAKDPSNPVRDEVCQDRQCVCSGARCANNRCCPPSHVHCVDGGNGCCATNFPVACPNNLCCPANHTCGGSCQQNCCAI